MAENKVKRCAIYTRKSVEDGLDQEFNSLDAQREAAAHLALFAFLYVLYRRGRRYTAGAYLVG